MEKRKDNSKNGTNTNYIKVITYSESVCFPYYSGRDVSGLFHLNW